MKKRVVLFVLLIAVVAGMAFASDRVPWSGGGQGIQINWVEYGVGGGMG